jgi:hypothetical protein
MMVWMGSTDIPFSTCKRLLSAQEPSLCENADLSKAKYRAYLLERLRVPAGVIFGHGIVNLALIQVWAAPVRIHCWYACNPHC